MVELGTVLLASCPIVIIFVGLAGFRISGKFIGPLGWLTASILAIFYWAAPFQTFVQVSVSGVIWTLVIFIWNIVGAFFFLNFLNFSGLLKVIRVSFTTSQSNHRVQTLLIGFAFALFLGAVAPGGSNFAITSLLLTSLGMNSVQASVIGLFGNGLQSPFGLLGTSTYALARVTNLDIMELSGSIGSMMLVFAVLTPLWMLFLIEGTEAKKATLEALLIGLVYGLVNWVVSSFLGPEFPNLLAGGSSIIVSSLLLRRNNEGQRIHRWAIIPFLIITFCILITRLIAPLRTILTSNVFTLVFDLDVTDPIRFPFLYSPGTLMILSTMFCAYLYKSKSNTVQRAFFMTLKQIFPILISVSSFVAMAEVMRNFGMTAVMAEAMALVTGDFYPFIAPIIGALGCAITGSTTASNIFFGSFQAEVAQRLGFSQLVVSSSQSVGCMAGEVVSPLNAIVVMAPLGMNGQEGKAIRSNLFSSLLYVILAAALTYLLISVPIV